MEGKTSFGSSSSSSSSCVYDGKDKSFAISNGKSSSSGLFSSVFPPASTVLGRNSRSYDIFAPSKKQESAWNNTNNQTAGKEQSLFQGKDKNPAGQGDTCFLASSLHYGGRDAYGNSQASQTYGSVENYKKDGQGDSASSRGDWWEGSLYY